MGWSPRIFLRKCSPVRSSCWRRPMLIRSKSHTTMSWVSVVFGPRWKRTPISYHFSLPNFQKTKDHLGTTFLMCWIPYTPNICPDWWPMQMKLGWPLEVWPTPMSPSRSHSSGRRNWSLCPSCPVSYWPTHIFWTSFWFYRKEWKNTPFAKGRL